MMCTIALPCTDVMGRAYVDGCPVDCIYEGERALYVHPDECIDCGAYEPVCPVETIYYEDDLPEEWSVFGSINAKSFDDIGLLGGAQCLGPTGSDHPYVTGLPP